MSPTRRLSWVGAPLRGVRGLTELANSDNSPGSLMLSLRTDATQSRPYLLPLASPYTLYSIPSPRHRRAYFTSRNLKHTGAPTSKCVPVGESAPVAWSILKRKTLSEL